MSDSKRYDLTDADFSQARADARDRAAYQWENPSRWHFWTTYHSEINPDFFDPWFESEISGPTNLPSTGPGDTAYKMTVNLYYCYCWFKYKGYNKYSFCAMMASADHESSISGGPWEGYRSYVNGYTNKHPYSNIKEFNPESLQTENLKWYTGGTFPEYAGSELTWTATYTDFLGNTWSLDADSGSWDCVKQYPLALGRYFIDGYGMRTMPEGSCQRISVAPEVWTILPQDQASLRFNRSAGAAYYQGDGRGYGMCQWTPWTRMPLTFASGYNDYHIGQYKDANKHWQMNGTLHLMLWELQRYINGFDYGGLIPGGHYYGEWINSRPKAADIKVSDEASGRDHAYFIYPYQSNNLHNPALWYMWTTNITWDQYARGDYLAATNELIEYADEYAQTHSQASRPMTSAEAEWCRRQMALGIYRSAFLQVEYEDYGFQEITDYIMRAWNYWDQHPIAGDQGWSVMDIPRPRDIPYCELDMYHIEFPAFFANKKRRRKHGSTILF